MSLTILGRAYVALHLSALKVAGCHRSQVNYDNPSFSDRYENHHSGSEPALQVLSQAVVMSLINQRQYLEDR